MLYNVQQMVCIALQDPNFTSIINFLKLMYVVFYGYFMFV